MSRPVRRGKGTNKETKETKEVNCRGTPDKTREKKRDTKEGSRHQKVVKTRILNRRFEQFRLKTQSHKVKSSRSYSGSLNIE